MKPDHLFQDVDGVPAHNSLHDHILPHGSQTVKHKLVHVGPGWVILWHNALENEKKKEFLFIFNAESIDLSQVKK